MLFWLLVSIHIPIRQRHTATPLMNTIEHHAGITWLHWISRTSAMQVGSSCNAVTASRLNGSARVAASAREPLSSPAVPTSNAQMVRSCKKHCSWRSSSRKMRQRCEAVTLTLRHVETPGWSQVESKDGNGFGRAGSAHWIEVRKGCLIMLEIACASFWFILSTNNFTHITKMLGHLWAS